MKKKFIKITLIILAIIIPVAIFLLFAKLDFARVWNTWGLQEDGVTVKYPDLFNYLMLILYKGSLYIIPPLIISIGLICENRKKVINHKKLFYIVSAYSYWFLALLVIKILADNIFEVDAVFNFNFFNSIKEIQALVGYIVSMIIKQNVKIDEGFIDKDDFEKKFNP